MWLRWFLLVSAQSWRCHRPRRRGHVGQAKRRRQPGWWILESRGGIRPTLALRSPIVPLPSPCDRHGCCLCWISLLYDLSFFEKYALLTNLPFGIQKSDHLALGERRVASQSRLYCTAFLPSEHRSQAAQASAQFDLVAPLPTVCPTIFCAFVRQPSSPHSRVRPNGIACVSARDN